MTETKTTRVALFDLEEAVELLFAGNMTRRTLRNIEVTDSTLLVSNCTGLHWIRLTSSR
jgi:hypothetical protein